MHQHPTLSLLVLRVSDIERSVEFYSAVGLNFECEQHGTGPKHFSASVGDTVFELYPATERFPATASRVGFAVASITSVLDSWRQTGIEILSEPKDSPYGIRAVVSDPDGHRVELTQRPDP